MAPPALLPAAAAACRHARQAIVQFQTHFVLPMGKGSRQAVGQCWGAGDAAGRTRPRVQAVGVQTGEHAGRTVQMWGGCMAVLV